MVHFTFPDFRIWALAYTHSAQTLRRSLLARYRFSDYEAYPLVFLYRHPVALRASAKRKNVSAIVDTPRLVLDRLTASDVSAFLAYRNDPEVARYQSWDSITLAEASQFVESQAKLAPGMPGEWFQFAVRLKPSDHLIGDCGLFVEPTDRRVGELGFTFGRDHQRLGLATEAAQALLRFAFGVLHLQRVKAVVDCRNTPAIRLLERVGLRRDGHFVRRAWFKGAWCDEYLYAALATDWQRHPAVT